MIVLKTREIRAKKRLYGRLGLLIGLCLLVAAAAARVETVFASQEIEERSKGALYTYSLEDTVIAALKQNSSLRQAEMEVEQTYAMLLAQRGTAELQGFLQPVVRAGSLSRLELADRAVSDEKRRDEAAHDNAWEGGLKLGFSKAIPSGGRFLLELDWGVVQGLSSPTLGEEAYTTDLSSRMTWEQPLGRDPKTMEPWWVFRRQKMRITRPSWPGMQPAVR